MAIVDLLIGFALGRPFSQGYGWIEHEDGPVQGASPDDRLHDTNDVGSDAL